MPQLNFRAITTVFLFTILSGIIVFVLGNIGTQTTIVAQLSNNNSQTLEAGSRAAIYTYTSLFAQIMILGTVGQIAVLFTELIRKAKGSPIYGLRDKAIGGLILPIWGLIIIWLGSSLLSSTGVNLVELIFYAFEITVILGISVSVEHLLVKTLHK